MNRDALGKVIDEIREGLKKEGGDIELVDVRDEVIYVRLLGQCSSCMMAGLTMKNWVEKKLKDAFPELKEVRAV